MRLLKISSPAGWGEKILRTGFSVGIKCISLHQTTRYFADGQSESSDVIDIETSTPKAKLFVDKLLTQEYYNQDRIHLTTREPRSIVSGESVRESTIPLVEPAVDLYDELWRFSHLTYGLLGRIFISACLLSYGMIEGRVLVIIGGLLFLPILPMVMAICYGIVGRQRNLAWQGAISLSCSTAALFLGGVLVATLSHPPMRFQDMSSPAVGIAISLAVGVAAALASVDDAGRRELIGLAAASQIGIIPAWLGVAAVFGLQSTINSGDVVERVLSFAANLLVLMLSVSAVQLATGVVGKIRYVKG